MVVDAIPGPPQLQEPDEHIEIWILHKSHEVLVTDFAGSIPAEVLSFVSEEAKQSAQARGTPTISEIGFNPDDHVGPIPNWTAAMAIAADKAKVLGYTVEVESLGDMDDEDEDEDEDEDFENFYDSDYDDGEDDDDFEDNDFGDEDEDLDE